MPSAIIIGSGPAAAAAALSLARRPDVQITILDLGVRLEPERQKVVDRLSSSDAVGWDDGLVGTISEQPVRAGGGLPEKRTYGSSFPFRDIGQMEGVTTAGRVSRSLISAAYGGFSNVWGAQVMPFAKAVFDDWPVGWSQIEGHYRAVLDHLPFAADRDDLEAMFPLLGEPAPLPRLSVRSERVLDAYAKHRASLNRLGLTIGKARLAFQAGSCVRCGLCMTGCPYSLIYSSAQTFDQLRRNGRVTYHGGLLALSVSEDSRSAVVTARELATGQIGRFSADRVYVAGGAMGTTRIIVNSLRLFDRELSMSEAQQFVLPMLSRRATPDPRQEAQFTLNQFNMIVSRDEIGYDVSQLHFYTHNPAFVDALPRVLRASRAEPAMLQLLRRLSVALGYLPSWNSPRLVLRTRAPSERGALPEMIVSEGHAPPGRNRMLGTVIARTIRASPLLDLYPVVPMLRLAPGGKSYHWGGTFPHSRKAGTIFSSDSLGRVGDWRRIHLVDASVFPNVPATTFTLTVMANAHRIAAETLNIVDAGS